MVGYGGATFAMTLLDRGGLTEPSDCGQSMLTDGGVTRHDGGGIGPGGDNGDGGSATVPRVDACLCGVGQGHAGTAGWGLLAIAWSLIAVRLARGRGRGRHP